MVSTPEERLFLIGQAFGQARKRRARDLKDAASQTQANAILKNCDQLEALFLDAALKALDANSAAVEQAYAAALDAQAAIDAAYMAAKKIAERVALVGTMVGKVGTLIKAASGS